MRSILALAAVMSASLVMAEQRPGEPTPAGEVQSDPPRTTGWSLPGTADDGLQLPSSEPAADPRDAKASPGKISINITRDSLTIRHAADAPLQPDLPGTAPAVVIVCEMFDAVNAPDQRTKLLCKNCEIVLPAGARGSAAEVAFDGSNNHLTLTGSENQPVKLTLSLDGTILSAAKIELDVKFTPPATLAPVGGSVSQLPAVRVQGLQAYSPTPAGR